MIIGTVKNALLEDPKDYLFPGTIVAFSGKGFISKLIRARTFSRISHIGIMYDENTIVEATRLRGFTGVVKHPFKDIANYKGKVYICNINELVKKEFGNTQNLQNFLDAQVGKKYDVKQAGQSGLDLFDWLPGINKLTKNHSDQSNQDKWFCSEIGYAALEKWSPLVFSDVNESELTPKDVWTLPQFTERARII